MSVHVSTHTHTARGWVVYYRCQVMRNLRRKNPRSIGESFSTGKKTPPERKRYFSVHILYLHIYIFIIQVYNMRPLVFLNSDNIVRYDTPIVIHTIVTLHMHTYYNYLCIVRILERSRRRIVKTLFGLCGHGVPTV